MKRWCRCAAPVHPGASGGWLMTCFGVANLAALHMPLDMRGAGSSVSVLESKRC